MPIKPLRLAAIAAAATLCAGAWAQGRSSLEITPMPVSGGQYSHIIALTDSGYALGNTLGDYDNWLRRPDGTVLSLGAGTVIAAGVGNNGTVVGEVDRRAAIWTPAQGWQALPGVAEGSRAWAINASGEVLGTTASGSFLWPGAGSLQMLNRPPGTTAAGLALNDAGTLAVSFGRSTVAGALVNSGLIVVSNGAQATFLDAVAIEGGTLNVVWWSGFAGAAGDSFDLFDWNASVSGRFGSLVLPALADGLAWQTGDLYAGGTLSIAAVPEPAAWLLMLTGVGALRLARRSGPSGAQPRADL